MPGRSVVRRSLALLTSAALLAVGSAPIATGASAPGAQAARRASAETVVVISVDALNPAALRRLGTARAPHLNALVADGASTLNARTERELTLTLPNHTGMVTGRRIQASRGGHGVTWNDDRRRPATVQAAAGGPVESVFTVVDDAGLSAGFFASKSKFSLWDRSWPLATDAQTIVEDNQDLVRAFKRDLRGSTRALRFLHLSEPDVVGHDRGFMGPAYLRAVQRTDRRVGAVLDLLRSDARYAGRTTVILTADHGGRGASHSDPTKVYDYRVPFVVWGAGVDPGTDLYALNPDYADPGRGRPTYAGTQPVRNGDVANLALDLLGLPAVPGSEYDVAQDLDVSAG
jgi:predicted AlkP superfamily pyrophosphatase or phosphodiesterase